MIAECGASFSVTIGGKTVVDLWGGYADAAETKQWEEDTIVNVYSTSKFVTAICVLMLAEKKIIDIDAPVADYWPEFAQSGKENITVLIIFYISILNLLILWLLNLVLVVTDRLLNLL